MLKHLVSPILAFLGFSKKGNSDNNLALVNFLILGFIVFS